MMNNFGHDEIKIAAVQEELINSRSYQIQAYKEKLRKQALNIQGLEQELERLRGVLTNIIDTVSPLRTETPVDIYHPTRYNTTYSETLCPEEESLDVLHIPNRATPRSRAKPIRINKELPPRPVSEVPSIAASLITDYNPPTTRPQHSQTAPTSTPRYTGVINQPPTPTFYSPSSPRYTLPRPLKSATDPLPSQEPTFSTRIRATEPPSVDHITRGTRLSLSISAKKRHSSPLPPVHESLLFDCSPPPIPPSRIAPHEENLSPRLLTPDEFFCRSGLSSPHLPKERMTMRLRSFSSLRKRNKGVEDEKNDEVMRARIREELEKRKKKAFGGVERVARSNVILSTVAIPVTETVKSGRAR